MFHEQMHIEVKEEDKERSHRQERHANTNGRSRQIIANFARCNAQSKVF